MMKNIFCLYMDTISLLESIISPKLQYLQI